MRRVLRVPRRSGRAPEGVHLERGEARLREIPPRSRRGPVPRRVRAPRGVEPDERGLFAARERVRVAADRGRGSANGSESESESDEDESESDEDDDDHPAERPDADAERPNSNFRDGALPNTATTHRDERRDARVFPSETRRTASEGAETRDETATPTREARRERLKNKPPKRYRAGKPRAAPRTPRTPRRSPTKACGRHHHRRASNPGRDRALARPRRHATTLR